MNRFNDSVHGHIPGPGVMRQSGTSSGSHSSRRARSLIIQPTTRRTDGGLCAGRGRQPVLRTGCR